MISSACICAQLLCPDQHLECSLEDISVLGFTFDLPQSWIARMDQTEGILLHFYLKTGLVRVHLHSDEYTLSVELEEQFFIRMRLETDSAAYRMHVLQLMQEFNEYASMKSRMEMADISEQMTGYPAMLEQKFRQTSSQQTESWFSAVSPDPQWDQLTQDVGLCMTTPSLLEAYLETPPLSFPSPYSRFSHPLMRHVRVLYFGSMICPFLLPSSDLLIRGIRKAQSENFHPVVSFPPLIPSEFERAARLLSDLIACLPDPPEVSLNDWGMLHYVHEHFPFVTIELGPLLNRTSRDVRASYVVSGFETSSLLADFYLQSLQKLGVARCSAQCHEESMEPLPIPFSLCLPFFQMNTSLECTLRSAVSFGARGELHHTGGCSRPCRNHSFLYPDFLHMIGKYNTLFGFDRKALSDSQYLQSLMGKTCDRIVLQLFEEETA